MVADEKSRSGKVTIRTVAADAGVSVAAVSKVLRNAYGVSDQLRERVEASIQTLGYRPSTAARGMRGKTYAIGVLLVDMANPFLPLMVDGIQSALKEANYKMLIGVSEAQAQLEHSLIDSMIDMRMDGVLLIAPRLSGEALAKVATQIPTTVVGHHEPTAERFDTINSNDQLGARLAVEALIEAGHKDIHMVSLHSRPGGFDVCSEREIGYRQAMHGAGLQDRIRIQHCVEGEDPGALLSAVMAAPQRPDAIFCWSDLHAVDLLNVARVQGIAVPDDLAIVGYDNTRVAALPLINLSSIDQRAKQMGGLAVETLLSRVDGRKVAEHLQVDPILVRRSSG